MLEVTAEVGGEESLDICGDGSVDDRFLGGEGVAGYVADYGLDVVGFEGGGEGGGRGEIDFGDVLIRMGVESVGRGATFSSDDCYCEVGREQGFEN